jgi:diadenosine tetraphosphate (Ap4A) HIT family hydrolase
MLRADVRNCNCDESPEAMAARECALCREADAQKGDEPFFFLKDANPNKPNRILVLPRSHGKKPQDLAGMTPRERAAYWTAAIAKARELWGEQWGLAVNSLVRRTQCHAHIHIGKLLDGVEKDGAVVVATPAEFPVPEDGSGMWVHPVGGQFHVHMGEDAPEPIVLQR